MNEVESISIAQRVSVTMSEGPGRRFAIWVQGCPLRCVGCCNPEMLPERGGKEVSVLALVEEIAAVPDLRGVTFLGGEPFAQARTLAQLAQEVRCMGLDVMVFSGYTLAELRQRTAVEPGVQALLDSCDLLVDGPYMCDQPEHHRRWIGSRNQQMHFLTDRYDPSDPVFVSANTIELRLDPRSLAVHGWPSAARAVLERSANQRKRK